MPRRRARPGGPGGARGPAAPAGARRRRRRAARATPRPAPGQAADRAAAVGPRDRQHGPLDGEHRVTPRALDLGVGLRDGADRGREPLRGPARELAARTVDLPGREPQVLGRHPAAAAHRADLREGAELHRQGRDERHRVRARRERVPQERHGLPRVPRDRGVRDPEPGRLDPAAVVPVHHGLAHGAVGVRDELAAGCRQLPQVVAECLDESPHARRVDASTGPAELGVDERHLVGVLLDRLHRDDGRAAPLDRVEHALAAHAAPVHDDDRRRRVGDRHVVHDVRDERVRRRLGALDDDHLRLAEQRRARRHREHPGLVRRGLDRHLLDLGVALSRQVDDRVDGTLREERLGPLDEHHGREPDVVPREGRAGGRTGGAGRRGHGPSLPRAAHRQCRSTHPEAAVRDSRRSSGDAAPMTPWRQGRPATGHRGTGAPDARPLGCPCGGALGRGHPHPAAERTSSRTTSAMVPHASVRSTVAPTPR